jgi:IclR family KDG regulon transcriptional repressor
MSTNKTISAVSRAFIVLEKLSGVSSLCLEDIAKACGLAKPTVYRFLLTLRDLGYVRRGDGDRWFLTMKLFSVGSRALDHIDLPTVARPVAEALSASLGETVHMGILDGDEVLYVLKIESRYTIRMYSRVGKRVPLYCSAMGKALLANLPAGEREALLGSSRPVKFTPNTITDATMLERELDGIKSAGYATDREEHEQGIVCLAAPILGMGGAVVAALSCSWPAFRFDPARSGDYSQAIRAAADEIASILGG